MIRGATVNDSARIAEIDVLSSRFAYQGTVPEECLYRDLTVENRIPVHQRWIAEKRFEIYVYEDPATGTVRGMMGIGMSEDDDKKEIGRSFYVKNHYLPDGKEKIFKRWNRREIRYVKACESPG